MIPIPFETPLNAFQKGLISTPYNESGIRRGLAYLFDSDNENAIQRLRSPNYAIQGTLEYQPTAEQLALAANSQSSCTDDEYGYTIPTAAVANGVHLSCSAIVGMGVVSPAAFFGLVHTHTLTVGACLGTATSLGAILGLAIFEGIVIGVNISRIQNSEHYTGV